MRFFVSSSGAPICAMVASQCMLTASSQCANGDGVDPTEEKRRAEYDLGAAHRAAYVGKNEGGFPKVGESWR